MRSQFDALILLSLLYASTRVRFYIVLHHSRHLSITTISSSYLPFVIVYLHLFVFRPSSFSLLRIYSTPIMFWASFLGFVAGLSYCNIFTFLWLDNKFIVFVILWLNYVVWCQSSKHHQLCIAEIGRPNLAFFLIPLMKVVLLVIQTNLSDRFLIGSKLGEL